jgi:hypothetical protein
MGRDQPKQKCKKSHLVYEPLKSKRRRRRDWDRQKGLNLHRPAHRLNMQG